ncbi:LysR family transcriptional regulator [Mesorhizobium sp.]|uniref:LysR family transcriptional regulator n=1 Tax=Mesorhizobium sp. TaxID=1871066 RepID=UPI000FE7E495|nr:LysR family transcriptional regulator [Mesorhizobium sp.]RWI87930.1 MAG: LysR family transcriptional regulator [Mesorhizobium sp.]
MIEFRQLRYFAILAEELHFSRAARRLNLSQPPLTQQIQNLERVLGVKLFLRNTRSVQLTEPGRAFLERVRVIIDETERAVAIAKASAKGEEGHLVIGHAAPADLQMVPHLISRFSAQFPNVRLTLHSLRGAELLRALQAETIQVALLRAPVQTPRLASLTLTHERLVAVVPSRHPLANETKTSFARLASESIIFFPRSLAPTYFDTVARLCSELGGFVFAPKQEVETSQTAIALVAANMGISLQPTSIKVLRREGVEYLDLIDCPRCVELAAAFREDDASPILRNFLGVIETRDFDD